MRMHIEKENDDVFFIKDLTIGIEEVRFVKRMILGT